MKTFHREFLVGLIRRAKQTGTMADAAYAADYMAKHSGCAYADCMNALLKYGLRYADRACKNRRSMFTEKRPENDPIPVKFDRSIISETPIPVEVPVTLLASL